MWCDTPLLSHFSFPHFYCLPHHHSTHVSGTACGDTFGVAANCELCPVKVLASNGIGTWTRIIAVLNHVLDHCKKNWTGKGLTNYGGPGKK